MKCFSPYYFDVDETLVLRIHPEHKPVTDDVLLIKEGRFDEYVIPNNPVIRDLKWLANRGHTIIVWSKEGADWAEAAANALGLAGVVDLCLEKPTGYYDDLESTQFMGKRHYARRDDV